jgi:hypothetical protein
MTVDVKKLPPGAIHRKYSPYGYYYYRVHFTLAIIFNTALEFKFLYEDTEYGSVKASYSEHPLENALMMMRQPSEE